LRGQGEASGSEAIRDGGSGVPGAKHAAPQPTRRVERISPGSHPGETCAPTPNEDVSNKSLFPHGRKTA